MKCEGAGTCTKCRDLVTEEMDKLWDLVVASYQEENQTEDEPDWSDAMPRDFDEDVRSFLQYYFIASNKLRAAYWAEKLEK